MRGLVDMDKLELATCGDVSGHEFHGNQWTAGSGAARDATSWKKVGEQKGTNAGGTYQDPDGKQYYVKFPKTPDHAKNEVLASKLYEEAGVRTSKSELVTVDGKVGVASEIIPDLEKKSAVDLSKAAGARGGFAADAWLANWDSVGTGYDNMLVDKAGNAVRIDPGGSLLYRAQGSEKGGAFGPKVGELETLRNPSKNPYAGTIFAGLTERQSLHGAAKIAAIPDARIRTLVDIHGPGDAKGKAALADKIIARKNDIATKHGLK
jgi:hypothetical protein